MCQRAQFSFLASNGTKAHPLKRVSTILFLISVTKEPRDGLIQAWHFTSEHAQTQARAEPCSGGQQSQPSLEAPDSRPEGPLCARPCPGQQGQLGIPGCIEVASPEDS